MSLEVNGSQLRDSMYFHRDYRGDMGVFRTPVRDRSWQELSQRAAFASLPFFSLYKPFTVPLALGMGSIRVLTSASDLCIFVQAGNSQEIANAAIQTAIAVSALAGTILMHPLGMLITTGQDAIIDCGYVIHHLNEGEYEKALKRTISLVNNTLYLGVLVTGSLEVSAASFTVQALLGLYNSYDDFNQGRWIEGTSHLLMSAIRTQQAARQVRVIDIRRKIDRAVNAYVQEESQTQRSLPKSEVSDTSGVKPMKADASQIYETYLVYTDFYGGYHFHVADYSGRMRVITCLDGEARGIQGIFVNDVQMATSTMVIWYPNHFVHYYADAKIISYEHRQICETY